MSCMTYNVCVVSYVFFLERRIQPFLFLVDHASRILYTGFYGDKILYKNLKFFDKIFVPTFCRRRFRNAPYGEKVLKMWKCYVWIWFRQTRLGSPMRGRYKILICRRLEMATYSGVFFFYTWVRFAREGKAVAL